ncbi:CRISPR-associated endoribonuclease Cas6 [Anaerocolumna jejuensis]|uniref:CRISPR-associated endoribonuclease Cas6 n=1 Tax=Anaerocolumna jejuensis TaxID=259063 RepID=UPI003F7CB44C
MENITVYHIDCKIYLLSNIPYNHILSEISAYVDTALSSDSKMLEFHRSYQYKNYVLSGFKELEADKYYKEGKVYTFSLRCVQKELCDFFLWKLPNSQTITMKGLVSAVKIIPPLFIERLYTITPALIKVEEAGYWKGNLPFDGYEKRLFANSVKKYKQLTGEEIDENFTLYSRIQFLNQKPVANQYKGITFLGDKLELYISDNEMAQKISYMLLGTGIMENNSRGYGFLNYAALR